LGDKCYIPAKLLRTPINGDRQDLLEQLHDCGAEIDWVNSTAGEAAMDIWNQAMAMRNWKLVKLMSDLRVGHQEGDQPARLVVSSFDWGFDMLAKIAEFYPSVIDPQRRINDRSFTEEDYRQSTLWRDPVVAAKVFEKSQEIQQSME